MTSYKVIAREIPADDVLLRQRSARIVRALLDLGTTHAVGVPDNNSRFIFDLFESDPTAQVVPVCREGEAWAIASGLWVGGKSPVVIIQNTGFLESGDALRGTVMEMGVPLVALLGYRGYHSLTKPNPDSAARFFEPTLRAWGLPYRFLQDEREADVFQAAFQQAHASSRPVGVLMT